MLPATTKYICHNGAGYDNIDVDSCTKRGTLPERVIGMSSDHSLGIKVSHTPDINIYAVADLTIYLMIGALRQITAPSIAVRKGMGNIPIQIWNSL